MVTQMARCHLLKNRRHSHIRQDIFSLSVAYLLGDDVEKDDAKAKDYLLLALEGNVVWAAKALSALHDNKASEFYDVKLGQNYLPLSQDSRFQRSRK